MSIYSAFLDEVIKIAEGKPKPGQQGLLGTSTVPDPKKASGQTAAIVGPKGGLNFTKDLGKMLTANRAGKRIMWGG